MIVGNACQFAIESSITVPFVGSGQIGLGYFVVHICGYRYGVKRQDATLLACSLGKVTELLTRRGSYHSKYLEAFSAKDIAEAFRCTYYVDEEMLPASNGISLVLFAEYFNEACVWAPDGDEAFDDGSYILQFDVDEKVRLIAFQSAPDRILKDESLRELSLDAGIFYSVLNDWRNLFQSERERLLRELERCHP